MWLYAFDRASKDHRLPADMPPVTFPLSPSRVAVSNVRRTGVGPASRPPAGTGSVERNRH